MPTVAGASQILARTPAEAQDYQEKAYGASEPQVRDTQGDTAKLVARASAMPPGPARDRAMKTVSRLTAGLDDQTLQEYGLQDQPKADKSVLGRIGRAVTGVPGVKQVLNVLDRPTQAVQQLALGARDKDVGILGGIARAGNTVLHGTDPEDRTNLTQVLHGDEDYQAHGKGDAALNFFGDVALDPTTYLSLGTSAGAKAGLRGLAEVGEVGGREAIEAVTKRGLAAALEEGVPVEDLLRQAATKGGVRDVEKAVSKQLKELGKTGTGGARFAGKTLPGTAGNIAKPLGPSLASQVVPEGLRSAFIPRSEIGKEIGQETADIFGQTSHVTRSAADRGVTAVDHDVLSALKEAGPEGAVDLSDTVRRIQQESDKWGIGENAGRLGNQGSLFDEGLGAVDGVDTLTKIANDPAAVAQYGRDVYLKSSRAHMADELLNTSDEFGNRIGTALQDLTPDAAAAKGLVRFGAGNSEAWVPKVFADEYQKFTKNVTSDLGVKSMQDTMAAAQRAWKTSATVLPVSPAFFNRNFSSNIMLMVGNGFRHPEAFSDGIRVAWAMRKPEERLAALPARLQDLAAQAHTHYLTDAGEAMRDLGRGAGDLEKGLAGKTPGRLTKAYNKATDVGTGVNKLVEDSARIAMMEDGLRSGLSAKQAAQRADQTLFNYADVTGVEKSIKSVVPFYTFMRKNLGAQYRILMSNPKILTGQVHAQDFMTNALENGDGELPDWAIAAGYLPLGGNLVKFDTPLQAAAQAVAPLQEIGQVLPGGQKADLGAAARGLLGPVGGPVPGLAKAAVEMGTGKSLFTGNDLPDGANPLLNNLLPAAGRIQKTSEDVTSQNLPGLLGVGVRPIDGKNEDNVLIGRKIDAEESLKDLPLPELTALRAAGLVPPAPLNEDKLALMTDRERTIAERKYERDLVKYKRLNLSPTRKASLLRQAIANGPTAEQTAAQA